METNNVDVINWILFGFLGQSHKESTKQTMSKKVKTRVRNEKRQFV